MKNLKSVGIVFIIVSIFLFMGLGTQTKANINQLSDPDIVFASTEIKGIGEVTAQQLIENKPITNIEAVSNLPNIGEKKAKIINQHFTTIDTVRSGIFIGGILLAIAFSVVGSALVTCHYEKIKLEESRLDRAFFGEGK